MSLEAAAHLTQDDALTHSTAARNPYVFVVGCPRSGTTLLQRMLDNHPQLAVANDSHFIPRAIEEAAPRALAEAMCGRDPPLTAEIVEAVHCYHRFARLGLSDAAVAAAATQRTYAGFVGALYAEYGKLRGKPLAGEKTPDYVRCLPLLQGLFPWLRVVHIVRDGRDVALSTLQWASKGKGPARFDLWKSQPLAACALWWRWQTERGRRDAELLPKNQYCEVMYEELVARPEHSLRPIAEFLDLPFAPQMLAYYEHKTRSRPGLSAKNAWLPPTPGLRDWRTQMDEQDVELFEALAGDLLTASGYERLFPQVSADVQDTAQRCSIQWDEAMACRDARLAHRLGACERSNQHMAEM